jgi:HEPN domain-containing protein
MEELVKLISKKTGLSEEMSENVVNMVLDYIKKKLPPALGSQLDNLIENQDAAEEVLKGLSGLFGQK